MYKKLPVGSC